MRTRTRTCRLKVEVLEDRCTPSTFAAFDLANPDSGPFPNDRFTVPDPSELTGLRVNLPLPDAATRPSDYADISVINTLDGFNLQPRLSVAFSGAIDVNTVRSPFAPRRKSAGAGVAAWIWSRIFSRMAVVLCVVKTLTSTMSLSGTPTARAAPSASRSAFR